MKALLIWLAAIALAVVLVGGGVWMGMFWSHGYDGLGVLSPRAIRPGMMAGNNYYMEGTLPQQGQRGDPNTIEQPGTLCDTSCFFDGKNISNSEPVGTMDEAVADVERYVEELGYSNLEVTEVMQFHRNYYAIVAEKDTHRGAMELLVDPVTGRVSPEPGPNMMWNTKYGMMSYGRMMRQIPQDAPMTITAQQAEQIAQRWLDSNLPGLDAGEADAFYGYYTLHFLKNGQVEGMLGVNGHNGDVWYHSWHGDFVAMSGEHE